MYDYQGAVDWRQSRLYELAGWRNGLAFKDIDFSATGKPIIKIAELKGGITAQTARTDVCYDTTVRVSAGDMLFSWSGNPDTSIDVFRWRGEDGWLNQHIFRVTAAPGILPDYLFLLLRSLRPRFAEIARNKQTTGLGHVTVRDLKDIRVGVPSPTEQQAIADAVMPLENKIELNRRMNETLEASARALFRDWFVDFGPTRTKAEGHPAYLAPDLWSLFPDRLDNDDVPEGWCERPLDQIAVFLNGLALQRYPAAPDEESLPVIKIAELRSGISANSNRAATTLAEKYIVNDGDFLFSWSGSLLAKFWVEGQGALNQHLFKVTSDEYPAWFYSQWVWQHLAEFQAIAASKATTMGHIQRGHLQAAMTICPPAETVAALGKTMKPLHDSVVRNLLESRTLAETRDALLPKLMSGEIRVRDAEALAA